MLDLQKLIRTRDDDLLKTFPGYTRSYLRSLKRLPVRILIFDIETSQLVAKLWSLRNNDYVNPERVLKDWMIICWSAKWLFDDKILSDKLTPAEAKRGDDKRVTRSLWKLLNEADIVVAHNGDRFDIKKVNARFLKYGLGHPNYYKSIDTLKVARKEFALTSNKLDYICKYLGIDAKIDTGGIALWDAAEDGDQKALDKMSRYCDNDVVILEELYLEIRPYIRNHPSLEQYVDGKACPNCGSKELKESGVYRTQKRAYTAYRCECKSLCYKINERKV